MPVPDKIILNPLNTYFLRPLGLTRVVIQDDRSLLQVPVNDAMLYGTLYDGDDTPVPGLINVPFSPIGSPAIGDYVGQYDETFNPKDGGGYVLILSGSSNAGRLHIEIDVEIDRRKT